MCDLSHMGRAMLSRIDSTSLAMSKTLGEDEHDEKHRKGEKHTAANGAKRTSRQV